jgi:hypothetical protein
MILVVAASTVPAAELAALYKQIREVGPNGANSAPAATAWRELRAQPASAILPTLIAMDGASPLASNWLRSAIDAIVERETKAKKPLPVADLEAFLKDQKHSNIGRRLAFELICQADPAAKARLLPSFMDDPNPELRYEAVETAFDKVRKLPKPNPEADPDKEKLENLPADPATVAELKRLLAASRHFNQTAEIARELKGYDVKIDLTEHFGYVKKWKIIAAFDNTDEKGYHTAYPPEVKLDPAATPPGKNGEATKWVTVDSKESLATVDLNKPDVVGKVKNAVAYAFAEIEVPAEREVELRVASSTGTKIFLNGKEVFAAQTYHQSFSPDTHTAPCKLRAGKNVILLKVCQNDQKEPWAQDWKFQLRVCDSTGMRVPLKEVTP